MEALLSAADCCKPCPEDLVVNIPGPSGPECTPCSDGAPGENSYTTLTNPFTMPAEGDSDTADVVNSDWMAVGQKVFIGRPDGAARGTLEVVSKPDSISVELLNVEDAGTDAYLDNSPSGTVFASASVVSPSGLQGPGGSVPGGVLLQVNALSDIPALLIPNARSNLGLGTMAVQNANNVAITDGNILIAAGGTNASTALEAINNLSPLTTKGDLLTHNGTNNIRRAVGSALNMVPAADGAGDWNWKAFSSIFGGVSILTDQGASTFAPEAITLGNWTKARLNTTLLDPGSNIVALAASVFELRAGVYLFLGAAQVTQVFCRFRMRKTNAPAATAIQGIQVGTKNNSASVLPVFGMLIASTGDTFEWQYYATNDGGGGDFGDAMSTGDIEVYKSLMLLRIG